MKKKVVLNRDIPPSI